MIEQNNGMNIKSRNQLLFELNDYRNNISKNTYNYMLSLLNLELSALEDVPNNLDLLTFKNNPLFIDIISYNIYSLAYKYCSERTDLKIDDQINNIKLLSNKLKVFEFYQDYSYENLVNGEVNLYKIVYDPEYNEMLDEKLSKELDEEYKNGFDHNSLSNELIYSRQKRIDRIKKQLNDLRDHIIPNDDEKRELETYEIYNESLMDFYNINQDGFESAKEYGDLKRKTLLKKVNDVKIYNNIRYI